MTVNEISARVNATLLTGAAHLDGEINRAFGSDMMSDALAYADSHTILLTGLCNLQVLRTAEMLRAAGGTEQLIHSIQTHNSDFNEACPAPELFMEKVLFAVDELTGLIGAAVIMRPSKSVMDFEVKSLKKKFKDKRFAAGCSRDVIRKGAELCGWELDELFDRTIQAMRSFAPDKDTFQPA